MAFEVKLACTISLLIYAALLINKTSKYLKLRKLYTTNIERLKHGIIKIEDLQELTPDEFEHWCERFLVKEGFYNICATPKGSEVGKDIICKKGNELYYVDCKSFLYNQLDIDIVKKLVGSMVSEKVTKGIIITSGTFTKEAIVYVKTLPSQYKILMYAGKDLVKDYNTLLDPLLCGQ